MNKIINWVKKVKLSQIILTFLAGALLIFNTACNSAQATAPSTRPNVPSGVQPDKDLTSGKNPRPEVPNEATTSRFQKGTMNDFSDLDPRAEKAESAIKDKAAALKENAERNVIDQTGSLTGNTKRILDKKGENAEDFGKNLRDNAEGAKDKIQGTAEDIAKGTKRGSENVKDNTLDATKGVNRAAENAKRNIDNTADNAKYSGKNLVNDSQNNVEKTGNFLQNKLNQAARNTK
ncbi:DUF6658 family protein [Chlorogloea sp. CCALA 695]|uniref:DUF6658 family protein n=1 Tax=Chlorogloea sp. CCALA 695 TaxID=2107693 RepID=UPI000D0605CD|nr:DUF6658 family protein [Chlorogloea sp. CCALA 695]PSB27595.1 hypothetical protein C7B70_22205 [Chlorogloea sp. CCALA 695]